MTHWWWTREGFPSKKEKKLDKRDRLKDFEDKMIGDNDMCDGKSATRFVIIRNGKQKKRRGEERPKQLSFIKRNEKEDQELGKGD